MDLSKSGASMEFDEHIQGVPVLEQLRAQRDCGRFCDVVFHVNRQEYLAHRNVLAACSRYFDSVFDINKSPREHVSVVCQDNAAFELVIDYIYTGKVTIHRSNATELLRLSNHFMVTKLKEYCCAYLEENVTASTCFSIKSNADMCGCHSLSRQCHYFILCNISEVIRQNEILEFTYGKIEHILSNKLYSLTQEEKFQLIVRWTKSDLQGREHFFKTLLAYVNWSSFSLDELYNSLKVNDIYVNSDTCLYGLLQVLDDNGVDLQYHIDALKHIKTKMRALRPAVSEEIEPLPPPTENVVVLKENTTENTHFQQELDYAQEPFSAEFNFPYKEPEPQSILAPMPTPLSPDCGLEKEGSDSDAQEDSIPQSESGTDEPPSPSPQKDGGRLHKRKGIPFKMDQTSEVVEKEDQSEHITELAPKRRAKPPKRFPCEQYEEQGSTASKTCKNDVPNVDVQEELQTPKKPSSGAKGKKIQNNSDSTPAAQLKRGRKKKEQLKCPKCDFISCNESRLSGHLRSAHKTEDVFKCGICEFSCRWNREYYRHMKLHFPGPPYACDYEECDYTVDRIHTLLHHRMRHSGERPYQCTECDQRFRTKNNLKTHLKSHSGEKPFKCEECGRCFATKGTLDQHSVIHSAHRPYLCELCGFSTKYQSHLILHNRIHKGEVFKCQYPKCDYSTPKRSQLGCHMRTHLQVKSHMCKTCGRGFIEKSHLVRHERIHLQDKPFKCALCEYSSTRRDKLKEHNRKHHEEKSPDKPEKPKKKTVVQPNEESNPEHAIHDVDMARLGDLPTDEMITADALDLDDRDLLRSSVVTTVTSAGALTMLTSNTLDTRGLGLLLPTVVTLDGRDDGDFRTSLMVEQAHMASQSDDDPDNPDFLEQGGSLHLQPLQNHTLHLQSSTDFHPSVSHSGRTSPEIPGLSSLMNIF